MPENNGLAAPEIGCGCRLGLSHRRARRVRSRTLPRNDVGRRRFMKGVAASSRRRGNDRVGSRSRCGPHRHQAADVARPPTRKRSRGLSRVSTRRLSLGRSRRSKTCSRSNLNDFLNLSLALENTGVTPISARPPVIFDKAILGAAASVAPIEARHAGFFNGLRSQPMTRERFRPGTLL